METSSKAKADGQGPPQDATEAQNLCLREEARLATVAGDFEDPLPESHLPLYRRGRGLLRHGFSPVAVRVALREQAPADGLTADQGEEIALRLLAAPEREAGNRFIKASETASALIAREIEKPPSVLGDGLLVAGHVSVLYGRPFVGKTEVVLRLALDLARGTRLFDRFETKQSRVGLISLELHKAFLKDRLTRLAGDSMSARSALDNIEIVARPDFLGRMDLFAEPADPLALIEWLRELHLDVLLIDPLSRCHTGDENLACDAGVILANLETLAQEAEAAILFVHHEGHTPGHPRGSSRLLSDPITVLSMTDDQGCIALKAELVNLGPPPEPLFLRRDEAGSFYPTDRPLNQQEAKARNLEVLYDLLSQNPSVGLTWEEAQEAMPANPDTGKPYDRGTVLRWLGDLKKASRAHNEGGRWYPDRNLRLLT